VNLDAFVVMPDHVHGIIVLTKADSNAAAGGRIAPGSLGAIVRSFKSAATARINRLSDTPGRRVGQRNYFERIVRDPLRFTGPGGTSLRIPCDGIGWMEGPETCRGAACCAPTEPTHVQNRPTHRDLPVDHGFHQ
jgi:hypothetical protein